jgi:hypothetical protein
MSVRRYHNRFETRLERHAALGKIYVALAIVTVVGLTFSLQGVALHEAIPAGDLSSYIDGVIFYILGYALEAFFVWLLVTFALFILSLLAGGKPYMGYLIRIVGVGMAPMAISSLFWSFARFQALNGQSPPSTRLSGISQEIDALNEYIGTVAGDPTLVQFSVLGCALFVITWYVWAVGTAYAADISNRKAAVFSAVCVLAYAYWKLRPVLTVF